MAQFISTGYCALPYTIRADQRLPMVLIPSITHQLPDCHMCRSDMECSTNQCPVQGDCTVDIHTSPVHNMIHIQFDRPAGCTGRSTGGGSCGLMTSCLYNCYPHTGAEGLLSEKKLIARVASMCGTHFFSPCD